MKYQLTDWTDGAARIVVTTCSACGTAWYLPREHCPTCGSDRASEAKASGEGLCVAVTRLYVTVDSGDPIGLALVELDEGVVVMARVHDGLAPGDRAHLSFVTHDDALLPSFGRRATA